MLAYMARWRMISVKLYGDTHQMKSLTRNTRMARYSGCFVRVCIMCGKVFS